MTPGARVAAAIEVLDAWRDGQPLAQVLTRWARASRFAGSKDRAAVRDHVYDAIRRWRSATASGGDVTGRAAMIGLLRLEGIDTLALFDGVGHAPAPLTPTERAAGRAPQEGAEALDIPDWLWPHWQESLGRDAAAIAQALQRRAPVYLRVNTARTTRNAMCDSLRAAGIETVLSDISPTALEVIDGARKVQNGTAYTSGLVELQDAASQAVVTSISDLNGLKVLDFCAGGGGKTLALAAATGVQVHAHDANPARMNPLIDRAARAGADVQRVSDPGRDAYDLVFVDTPCSGSGSWRRDPAGKWRLTSEGLAELTALQSDILARAALCVRPGGRLVYATCSVLACENADRIAAFQVAHSGWSLIQDMRFSPVDGPDGFYTAQLRRGGA